MKLHLQEGGSLCLNCLTLDVVPLPQSDYRAEGPGEGSGSSFVRKPLVGRPGGQHHRNPGNRRLLHHSSPGLQTGQLHRAGTREGFPDPRHTTTSHVNSQTTTVTRHGSRHMSTVTRHTTTATRQ